MGYFRNLMNNTGLTTHDHGVWEAKVEKMLSKYFVCSAVNVIARDSRLASSCSTFHPPTIGNT